MWKVLDLYVKRFSTRISIRCLSLTQCVYKSHYDVLGVTPKATQSDIKAAYYKLSMQYHPDKNKGEEAAATFRDITTAYEVLGNYKLRKLYDKGILHTAGGEFSSHVHPEDAFHASRSSRHKAPPPTGKTPIYDFDEWARAHYGQSFARRAAAKAKWESRIRITRDIRGDVEQEKITYLVLIGFMLFMYLTFRFSADYDVDKLKDKNAANEK